MNLYWGSHVSIIKKDIMNDYRHSDVQRKTETSGGKKLGKSPLCNLMRKNRTSIEK